MSKHNDPSTFTRHDRRGHQFIGGLVRPLLHEPADGEHLAEGVTRCAGAFIDYANGWLLANPEMSGKDTEWPFTPGPRQWPWRRVHTPRWQIY
jgi:hypothetical protein